MTELTPRSPKVNEVLTSSLTPVKKYNGLLDLSIPLYSTTLDGKSIDFVASYYSGGVKVAQDASWTGLNWSTNFIPTITRQINGSSDIGRGRPYSPRSSGYVMSTDPLPQSLSGLNDPFLDEFELSNLPYVMDTQPDIFIANLFGETVKFYLTQLSATGGQIETRIINESKAKIEYNHNNDDFTIIDDHGYKYFFELREYTSNYRGSDSNCQGCPFTDHYYDVAYDHTVQWNSSQDTFIVTSWVLTKLRSPEGNELLFDYYGQDTSMSDNDLYSTINQNNLYLYYSPTNVYGINGFGQCDFGYQEPIIQSSVNSHYSYSRSIIEAVYLKEVFNSSTGERMIFEISDRSDIKKHQNFSSITTYASRSELKGAQKLDKMLAFAPNGEIIKEVDFNYSYFNSDDAGNEHPDNYLRLKLDGLSIDGMNYGFEYESPNSLPSKTSTSIDFWGYYNGEDNGYYTFPKMKIYPQTPMGQCSTFDQLNIPTSGRVIPGASRGSKYDFANTGILKKVTFPTGGYNSYTYEGNTALVPTSNSLPDYDPFTSMFLIENNIEPGYPLSSTSNWNLKTFPVGGLRIAKVQTHDKEDSIVLKKKYHYNDDGSSAIPMSTGKLMNPLLYYYITESYEPFTEEYWFTGLLSSNNNKAGIVNAAAGSHIGYDRVEERIISNVTDSNTNGKIASFFYNEPNITLPSSIMGYPYNYDAPPINFEEANGNLIRQEMYDNIFNSSPKRIVENEYSYIENTLTNGIKVHYNIAGFTFLGMSGLAGSSGADLIAYDYYIYPVNRTYGNLTLNKQTDYFGNGEELVSETSYDYNNKPQLTSKTSLTSTGNIKQEFYYPYSDAYSLSSYPRMSSLVSENRIASPTYVRMYKNDQLIGHELQPYGIFNSTVQPSGINFQKEDAVLSDIEQRIIYDSYDDNGNITQVTQPNGTSTKYLWGYEEQRLVASIKNTPTNTTVTPIDEIVDINMIQNTKLSTSINSELDLLRTHPDYQNSQIESYAYNPSGMVQNSDNRGYRMNYIYDNKERLTDVKDNDDAILSQNAYNYLNENEPCSDCKAIALNTSSYTYFRTQNLTLNISMPSGIPSVQNWKVDFGDGNISEGNGNPSSSINHSYSINEPFGLKVIRVYANFNDQSFVTGNVNVRVAEGTIPGEDVRFGNIQTVSTPDGHPKKTARIYGSPGAQVSYKTFIAGSTSEQYGHTSVIGGGSHSLSGNYQIEYGSVTIPSSGYANCSIEVLYSPGGNLYGTVNLVLEDTTVGQIGSPSSLNVSHSSGGNGW